MSVRFPLEDLNMSGKNVLLRLDLNVPMDSNARVIDDNKIIASIPTIRHCLKNNAKLIVISHFGRPKSGYEKAYSLSNLVDHFSNVLGVRVVFANSIKDLETKIDKYSFKDLILLENLRFDPGECSNDILFAKKLSSFADIYINDAFACSHRSHASISLLPKILPWAYGFHMSKEMDFINSIAANMKRPLVSIMSGKKLSTKLPLIKKLSICSDSVVLSGGLANTIMHASGICVGTSFCENSYDFDLEKYNNIVFPQDVVTARGIDCSESFHVCDVRAIPKDEMILDIGPATVMHINKLLNESATVIWNGPLGVFEVEPFNKGTLMIASHLADLTLQKNVFSLVGGGDTAASVKEYFDSFSHVSTGGGAFLFWLEKKINF